MSLSLYFHPLSSFCHKALIALYENAVPFTPEFIDLSDPASRARLLALWPIGKFPVLHDAARNHVVPEASIIIEYLHQHYPGPTPLIPKDPGGARQMRMYDRFFDLYVNTPMQKIVTDRLRPEGQGDAFGVAQARAQLYTALDMIEHDMRGRTWVMGETFTMADCAAAPALYYANVVQPFADSHPIAAAYLQRLSARPSYARVLAEAQPYLAMMPN
ncbi:glutathione S-transferase family protein [Sinimarinibacterium sp. CAU 1509]|uniref:glutathione S-transferase family protein n=1 Tax=Sinimarinibacterium sp. CAU 1509 TaxID=2562283 RepID=UPI0010ABD8FA|nr:glutathione S-transferase family protein [Sinimarinibacterium sp. CAU 1509]TJY65279.1 glutathione S-transferase family protein [Sinimarinibacterium sp. CAU 1509]